MFVNIRCRIHSLYTCVPSFKLGAPETTAQDRTLPLVRRLRVQAQQSVSHHRFGVWVVPDSQNGPDCQESRYNLGSPSSPSSPDRQHSPDGPGSPGSPDRPRNPDSPDSPGSLDGVGCPDSPGSAGSVGSPGRAGSSDSLDSLDTTGAGIMTPLIRCKCSRCNHYTLRVIITPQEINSSFLWCDYYSNPFDKEKERAVFSRTQHWTTCQSIFCFFDFVKVCDVRKSTSRSALCCPCGHAHYDLCQAADSISQWNDGAANVLQNWCQVSSELM